MSASSQTRRRELPPEVYAAAVRGWRMLPVKAGQKAPPLIVGWPDKATCDIEELEGWAAMYPDCNWGIACGPGSGVYALDVDGDLGFGSLANWERRGWTLPATRAHETGRGHHLLFNWPPGFTFTVSTGKLGPGLDERGDHGYILAPPSVHPSGHRYVCVDESVAVADMPRWLIETHQISASSAPVAKAPSTFVGRREPLLFSNACKLRSQGVPLNAIEETLLALNSTLEFPHDPQRVKEIAAKGQHYHDSMRVVDGSEDHGGGQYSEDALALEFTRQHGNDLRFTAAWGRWSIWDGSVWKRDTTCKVFDLARKVCRAASSNCRNSRVAQKIASAATVAAIERLAHADRRHAATIEQWDVDVWLLNTPAGVVDLRTGTLRDGAREDYMTKITTVAPGGKYPLWTSFLSRITRGDIELQCFLQRVCGYALTGVTREHALFFLYGTGANGKSVFLNTVSGVMGDYARAAPVETFIASKSEQHPTDLAGLQGSRLVSAIETEGGRRWAESKLKTLTGGDRIAARFMRQDFFEYVPQFKIIVAGNHKPGLSSVDEAMRRRFHLLPFTVTVPAAERDPNLMAKLHTEWSGILSWMIDGCLEWQSKGLQAPKVVSDATANYLAAEDVLAQWIEDRCQLDKTLWTPAALLFEDWRKWCDENQEIAGSQKAFSENLESRGFAPKRRSVARGFYGIGLMTDMTGQMIIADTRERV